SGTALRAVAGTIETDLAQLASGRATLKAALTSVSNCSISPAAEVAQVASVIVNRQHVLAGLSRLATPTAQAARVGSLLRQALTYSIAADRHYRDWLARQGVRCPTNQTPDLLQAQREDALATVAKQSFVAAFNPLARQLHLRTWSATDF